MSRTSIIIKNNKEHTLKKKKTREFITRLLSRNASQSGATKKDGNTNIQKVNPTKSFRIRMAKLIPIRNV